MPRIPPSTVTCVPWNVRPERRIDDDPGSVFRVSSPRWRVVVSHERVSERVAGLPVAGAESPDVRVEEVVRKVRPGSQAGDFDGEDRGVARS